MNNKTTPEKVYNLSTEEIVNELERRIDRHKAQKDYLQKSIKDCKCENHFVTGLKEEICQEDNFINELQSIIDFIKNHTQKSIRREKMTFKEIREKADLTQIELAKKMKVRQSIVSNWENKRTNPKLKTIPKLAKALKVSEQEVLDCFK